jgi:hypothetical protein
MKGKYLVEVITANGVMTFYANTEKTIYDILRKNGILRCRRSVYRDKKAVPHLCL